MRPDWKMAPAWAQFVAMDKDGSWWWYEKEPVYNEESWSVMNDGGIESVQRELSVHWTMTLESRP